MAVIPTGITMGTTVTFGCYPTRTWYVDPVTNRLSGYTDGLPAMVQAVQIALSIRRFHWQIYSPNVGHELDTLGFNYDTARVGLQLQIKNALLADDRITDVTDFAFSQNGDHVTASFVVRTVFGDLNAEVIL